jgi:TRAP transporter TAXI family solute receptor
MVNRLSLLTAALVLLTPSLLPAFTQPTLSISSGSQTGTVSAVSNAITKIFNRKAGEYGYRLAAVPSEGSVADVNNVLAGETAFGIPQSAVLQDAAQGNGPWQGKGSNNLRAVLSLHAESLSIVAAADSGIRQLSDLKGKRVNVGAPGSADHQYAAAALLELAGLQPSEFTLTAYPASLASEYLHRDQIDAYIYLVGHPNLSVLEASSGPRKVVLVPLGMPLIAQIGKMNPLLVPAQIPTDFYPGLQDNGTISTVSLRDVLFTRILARSLSPRTKKTLSSSAKCTISSI